MIGNYVKTAIRNIKGHPAYTLINLSGLALGMAACILIFLWIYDEMSYDRFHRHGKTICRVISAMQFSGQMTMTPATAAPLASILESEYPEIKHAARLFYHPNNRMSFRVADKKFAFSKG